MTPWIILPVVLPAMTAALILLVARFDIVLQRILSIGAAAACLLLAGALLIAAADGSVRPYLVGAWPAPFGIVLVLDRLSALMLVLTGLLGLLVALHAAGGLDKEGRHFHALLQFQLMGVNGAFLTGDLFNLFVFFEILLIASYGLMLHGGGTARFAAGVRYIAVNLTGSALFLIGVGLVYAVTGALNMADLALLVPRVAMADRAILEAGAALLLVVFALKAALAPLHLWLPGTYAAAPFPVTALFAIMTKVGAYAMLRVMSLIFPGSLGGAMEAVLIAGAAATLLLGAIGALAARDLASLAAFALMASMGSLLMPLGRLDEAGITAALFYLVQSTLGSALLFLVVDLVARRRGAVRDRLVAGPAVARAALIGGLFLAAGLALTGLPPLAGFIGKLLVLQAMATLPATGGGWPWPWLWAAVLVGSLLLLIAFARSGALLFWAATPEPRKGETPAGGGGALALAAPLVLAAALVAATLASGPTLRFTAATARALIEPAGYIGAVLGPERVRMLQPVAGVAP